MFGVTGAFSVIIDHFKSSFFIGLKEETWFGNTAECCLHLTPLKVNGNWGLDSGYSILVEDPVFSGNAGYFLERTIAHGFERYGHNWRTFFKKIAFL